MYLEFYGLGEKPFSQTPDPRFLYWNDAYRETLASLSYGIRERKGFIAMLGEAGTGKTTLLRKLLDELGEDIVSVFLFNPNATFEEILEYTLNELGIPAPSGRKLAMLQRLNEFLLAAYAEGRNTILLIDEAQDLDAEVLESLRLLSNLETSNDKILQIVLSGQPELAEKLADPGLRQLKQRITVRCRLEPLQYEELASYLGARLEVAGGSPELFDPETFVPIWEFASGIPRIINTVCDNALLLGYALGKRTIDASVINEVLTDLRKLDTDTWLPAPSPRAESPSETPAGARPTTEGPAVAPLAAEAVRPPASPRRPEPFPGAQPALASSRQGVLGWVIAAVLAAAVLILAGAWIGRVQSGEPRPAAPTERSLAERAPGAMAPSDGTALADESTGPDTASDPAGAATRRSSPSLDRPDSVRRERPSDLDRPAELERPASQKIPPATGPGRADERDASSSARGPEGGRPPSQAVAEAAAPPTSPPESGAGVGPAAAPPGGRVTAPVVAAAAAAEPPDAPRAPAIPAAMTSATSREEDAHAPRAAPSGLGSDEGAFTAREMDESTVSAVGGVNPTSGREPSAATEASSRPARAAAPAATTSPATERIASAGRATRNRAQSLQSASSRRTQVSVAPGDTLQQLATRRYGTSNLTTLDMLQAVNPAIRDVDLIIAGSGLVFPDPGPASRILPDGTGYSVLAMTTQTLSRALALQSSLEDRLQRPVSLERLSSGGSTNVFRVSVRGLGDRSAAFDIASALGPILSDPAP